jgi:type VI secretion system protein ImpJ
MDRDIWKGTIPDDRYFEDSQFFLAVSSANETGELIQKVPLRIRAAAPDQIDRLIKNALAGINLIHTPAPPAIRMKLGNQYFALSQSGDLWQQVKNSRSIAIFTPADIKQPKLELIVLKNKRS